MSTTTNPEARAVSNLDMTVELHRRSPRERRAYLEGWLSGARFAEENELEQVRAAAENLQAMLDELIVEGATLGWYDPRKQRP